MTLKLTADLPNISACIRNAAINPPVAFSWLSAQIWSVYLLYSATLHRVDFMYLIGRARSESIVKWPSNVE